MNCSLMSSMISPVIDAFMIKVKRKMLRAENCIRDFKRGIVNDLTKNSRFKIACDKLEL